MAQPEYAPLALVIELREEMAELRANVGHLASDLADVRQEIRRLDGRLFQVLLAQLATLAAAFSSLVAALAG